MFVGEEARSLWFGELRGLDRFFFAIVLVHLLRTAPLLLLRPLLPLATSFTLDGVAPRPLCIC